MKKPPKNRYNICLDKTEVKAAKKKLKEYTKKTKIKTNLSKLLNALLIDYNNE